MSITTHPTTPSKSGTHRANALPSGCMLDEYRIDSILGAGGFGVTYKALDTHLENWVAIKEYFPVEWSFRDSNGVTVHPNTQGQTSATEGQLSDYLWGLERFLDEARVLARIQHPYVVRVKRYFRAHGTAYIVMDFEEGEPLSAILQDGETLGEDEVRGLLEDVMPALQAVHEQGYLHRDIKPANLYVRASDHRVILIDFGAAREAIGRHSKSVTSLVTPGYSPPEQYTTRNDRYGTWTDVYALGAVLYRCVTGHTPTEAAERLLEDAMDPAVKVCAGRYSTNLLRVIDRALAVRPELRFRTVAEMQAALSGSPDEDSDDTVIMAPLAKPGRPALGPELPRGQELSGTPLVEKGDSSGWLEITRPPTARSQPGKHLNIVQPLPKDVSAIRRRRRLLGVLAGGGLALAGLVAAVVWLWPAGTGPEEKPLVPQDLVQKEHAAEAPAAHPPVSTVQAPVPSTVPPSEPGAAETAVTAPPPAVEPAAPPPQPHDQAGTAPLPPPESRTVIGQPPAESAPEPVTAVSPPESASALSPPEPASSATPPEPATVETPSEPEVEKTTGLPAAAGRPATTLQPGQLTGEEAKPATDRKSQAREAATTPSRPARQRSTRKRKPQPAVVAPAESVQARPAPAAPKRSNLWDAPTDTGFNQK